MKKLTRKIFNEKNTQFYNLFDPIMYLQYT